MDVAVGWNGVLRAGRYAPLIVSLENPGKKIECVVSVEVKTGSELRETVFTSTHSQAVVLPARAGKRLFFTLPFSSATLPLAVTVVSGGAKLLEQEVDVGSMIVEEKLVVGISSELSLDFLSETIGGVRVVYPHIENLPDGWAGYDAVDVIVIHDTAFQNLRAAQVSALEKWVFSGGVLVFSGGPPALQFPASGLKRLLPVEVTDLVQKGSIRSIAAAAGARAPLTGEMIVARSRPGSAAVLAEEDGIPILVERGLGKGFIRWLAFDCTQRPAVSWSGNAALWKRLSAGAGQRPEEAVVGENEPVDEPWFKGMVGDPSLTFPSGTTLFLTLALYFLAIVGLDLKRKRGGMAPYTRAALLTLTAAAAGVSMWILFRGVLFRDNFMVEASVAETVSGDGLARITEKVGIFSAGGGEFGISTPENAVTCVDVVPQHKGPTTRNLSVETGNGTRFSSIRLGRVGSRLIALTSMTGMSVRASISPDRTLTVSNSSPQAMMGSFLRYKSVLYPVGDIPPGRSVELPFSASGAAGDDGAVVREPGRLAFYRTVRDGFDREKTFLFAWLDSSPLALSDLRGENPFQGRSVNLLVVEVK